MNTFAKAVLKGEADRDLAAMVEETNDGFKDGRVSKNELLSWIVCEFRKAHFKKSLAKIRDDHFDEVRHLEARIEELKAAKKAGVALTPQRKLDSKTRMSPSEPTKTAEE